MGRILYGGGAILLAFQASQNAIFQFQDCCKKKWSKTVKVRNLSKIRVVADDDEGKFLNEQTGSKREKSNQKKKAGRRETVCYKEKETCWLKKLDHHHHY